MSIMWYAVFFWIGVGIGYAWGYSVGAKKVET
jgi:hypothetical protein